MTPRVIVVMLVRNLAHDLEACVACLAEEAKYATLDALVIDGAPLGRPRHRAPRHRRPRRNSTASRAR